MLKYLIGRKKNQPPTTQEVIQKLRVEEDRLTKRDEVLQMKIDAETDTARKNASKNERGKLFVDMVRFAFDIKEVGNRSGCLTKQLAQYSVI